MRLSTMSRFAEPTEEKISGQCVYCKEYISEGQEVFEYDGDYCCDGDCMHDYLLKLGVIKCVDFLCDKSKEVPEEEISRLNN